MFRLIFSLSVLIALGGALDLNHIGPYIDIPLKPLKTSAERIREHGYPAESHFVETSDGYILNLFRIPYSPRLNNQLERKPVVFIQHGLFSCSDCFLLNGPENAIAYNFADAGFDVWLGNARGNIYSRSHSTLTTSNPKFWMFSWHEIGTIDMPESIDYVLEQTGESALHYVGHSQGGTVYFVMLSSRPEYNAKIKTGHGLAPAVYMGNVTDGIVAGLAPYVGSPGVGADLLSNQPFVPYNPQVQRLLDSACGGEPAYPKYCETLFLMWAGNEQSNLNATLLPQLAETHPAGISTNQGIHFIQLKVSNKFRQYDFGAKKNQLKYNQAEPPEYPLEKITADTFLYYGLNDGSANAKDMKRLPQFLPNLRLFHEVPNPTWGHLDFIFAKQVKQEINDPVVQYCKAYEEGY
ncbi:lipase 3 [Zeugodacus cucurbitae]|uniref:Lipase n=1 Tax=Zeugodacus cucurbitae TaxID=28588 RepID=A0A0A1WUS2_ZEUCU|nr:lipase 3 [Zeugodacus cucurbitae]